MFWTQRLRRSNDEFWSLSYREVYGCIDSFIEEQTERWRSEKFLTGTVCATIRNAQRSKKTETFYTWRDFFEDTAPGSKSNGQEKLGMTSKIRLRQLASFWQSKRGE